MKKIALAIGAHPDDIEIGCGGTISVLKDQGYEIVFLVVTSGEEGCNLLSKNLVAQKRETEARNSSAALGASEIIFLLEPDGLTSFSKELKIRLISLLRRIRPQTVFVHAESDHFPDHQVVHQLTMAAILACQGPWYPEAYGLPHRIQSVYGYEVWNPINRPQLVIDITNFIDRKTEALRLHASQIDRVNYIEAVLGLARYRGVTSMSGEYAEAFEIIQSGKII